MKAASQPDQTNLEKYLESMDMYRDHKIDPPHLIDRFPLSEQEEQFLGALNDTTLAK